MHDRRWLLALVAVTLLSVLAGSASARWDVSSLDGLLARHVPILVLHPAERLRPVAVEGFLEDSDLQTKTATGWEKVDGPLPAGGRELRLDQRLCRAVEGVPATSCYVTAQAAHGTRSVVYGAAFRRGRRIVLQYWLWYPWNAYSPTVPPGDIWQVHEGDWESVSLILDARGSPLVVGLSSHCGGTRRAWSKAPRRGLRPLVYVALGSHANVFRPGPRRLDPACWTPQVIAVIEAYGAQPVDRSGKGRLLSPKLVRVTATSPAWMRFAGTWGEDAYVHFPGNDPILYGTAPRGPAFHTQWRRPVAEVLSWPLG